MSQLWKFSDSIGEKLRDMQPYLAFDVGIPLKSMQAFIETVSARLSQAYPGATNLLFGHLGDGNLHLSTGPHAAADLVIVEEMVYTEVRRVGGSISAEHRSEEHTSELQSLMRISYAVFCLKKK